MARERIIRPADLYEKRNDSVIVARMFAPALTPMCIKLQLNTHTHARARGSVWRSRKWVRKNPFPWIYARKTTDSFSFLPSFFFRTNIYFSFSRFPKKSPRERLTPLSGPIKRTRERSSTRWKGDGKKCSSFRHVLQSIFR